MAIGTKEKENNLNSFTLSPLFYIEIFVEEIYATGCNFSLNRSYFNQWLVSEENGAKAVKMCTRTRGA